jgi:ubiquinone/menaquinone biosynthesis C-methylase UbiE
MFIFHFLSSFQHNIYVIRPLRAEDKIKNKENNMINTNIFSDFADLYDTVRPNPPSKIVDILLHYLNKQSIDKIVDLGSGTGLSTKIWLNNSKEIIGIEPTNNMRNKAIVKYPLIKFIESNSYNTGVETESVDIVTCSESFHWMEPEKTIKEVDRILKKDGLFCIYYCEWPVSWNWECEKEYNELFIVVNKLFSKNYSKMQKVDFYQKDQHYDNFIKSNRFRYVRKLNIDSIEDCDSERFINIALSQSQIQELLRNNIEEINEPIKRFKNKCDSFSTTKMHVFYTVIIGIK